MSELWLMLRHPWKVRRFLALDGKTTRGVNLTWAARYELDALRRFLAGEIAGHALSGSRPASPEKASER